MVVERRGVVMVALLGFEPRQYGRALLSRLCSECEGDHVPACRVVEKRVFPRVSE